MTIEITSVQDVGGDVLEVTGTADDGSEVTASGWVSATTNYYPPSDYGTDGNLVKGAKARQMTADEVGAYALALLEAVQPAVAAEPTPITFKAP